MANDPLFSPPKVNLIYAVLSRSFLDLTARKSFWEGRGRREERYCEQPNHLLVLCLTHRLGLFAFFLPDSAVWGKIESAIPEYAMQTTTEKVGEQTEFLNIIEQHGLACRSMCGPGQQLAKRDGQLDRVQLIFSLIPLSIKLRYETTCFWECLTCNNFLSNSPELPRDLWLLLTCGLMGFHVKVGKGQCGRRDYRKHVLE